MSTRPRRLAGSLRQISPVERTLLDLSLRRGVSDDLIGELLRISPLEVRERREVTLSRLALDLGFEGERERAKLCALLTDLPPHNWHPDGPQRAGATRRSRPAPPLGDNGRGRGRRGRRRRPDRGDGRPRGRRLGSRDPALEGCCSRPGDPLEPLGPRRQGAGSARLVGSGASRRLVVRVSGLAPLEEPYAVWLYDSVERAVLLHRFVDDEFTVDERLPVDAGDYRFIDVSREPLDGNPRNHSGASVCGRRWRPARVAIGLTRTRPRARGRPLYARAERLAGAISATWVGLRPTRTPCASSASAFACAVPASPTRSRRRGPSSCPAAR